MDNPNMNDQDIGGQEQPGENESGGEAQEFNIDPVQVQKAIEKHMNAKQIANLNKALTEINKLVFGKDTHYQLIDGLKNSQDVTGDLGQGAFGILMIIYKEGGYTMPLDIMDSLGVIMLARVCSFLNKAGIVPVSNDDYEAAVHVFTVKLHSSLDPNFNKRMEQATGQPAPTSQQPQQPQQPTAQPTVQGQQPAPQGQSVPINPGGLLNQGAQ